MTLEKEARAEKPTAGARAARGARAAYGSAADDGAGERALQPCGPEPAERAPLLEFDRVEVSFGGRAVVRDVSFSVMPGEALAIVGESGSGKSTLCRAAMGLLDAGGAVTRGDVWFDGANVAGLPERRLRVLRGPGMGMVFQDSLAALNPVRTVGAQAVESLRAHERTTRAEALARMAALLERFGLDDPARVLASYPFELSGGMGQRAGLALAMLLRPRLLFADEPTSALDAVSQAQVVREMASLRAQDGLSMVVVTHNMGVACALADAVLVLKDGAVVEYGPASQVLERPQSAYARELLDAVPRLRREDA